MDPHRRAMWSMTRTQKRMMEILMVSNLSLKLLTHSPLPSLNPELRLLHHPELSLPFFHVVVTWFASLAVLSSNTVTLLSVHVLASLFAFSFSSPFRLAFFSLVKAIPLARLSPFSNVAFVCDFSSDSFLHQDPSADFQLEDFALGKNLRKLYVSDEAGVEVTTTPSGHYNTNIQKQSMSRERGIAADSIPSENMGAQKYKVKENKSPDNK
jgi:hypothetical protein